MAEWNTAKHLMYLYEEISLLQLPRFKYGDFDSSSWEQVCEDVWAYVSAVVAQNKGRPTVNLVSRYELVLYTDNCENNTLVVGFLLYYVEVQDCYNRP